MVTKQFVDAMVKKLTGTTLDERTASVTDLKSKQTSEAESQGIGNAVGDAAKGLGTGVGTAADGIGSGVGKGAKGIGEGVGGILGGLFGGLSTIIFIVIGIVVLGGGVFVYMMFFRKKNQLDPLSKLTTSFGKLLFGKKKIKFRRR